MTSHTKNINPNLPTFLRTRLSTEGLNSSSAQSAGELQSSANMAKVTFCRPCFFNQNLGLGHNFVSRNARKLIKGSKGSDYSLVSNKSLSQKTGSLGWRPGPMRKPVPLMTSPTKSPKSQTFQ